MDSSTPPLSRRETAKGERRARIVDAACELLRENGVEDLSVKAVAARARVSLSTLYNLFASKDAILTSVYDQDLLQFAARVEAANCADALDRVFLTIDISAELYGADPSFYRAIMRRDTGAPPNPARDAWLKHPRMFWRNLLAGAVDEGLLRPNIDTAVLNVLLNQVLSGVVADWLQGRVSEARFAAEAKFALATLLSAFAKGEAVLRLRKMIANLHRQLGAEPRIAGVPADAAA